MKSSVRAYRIEFLEDMLGSWPADPEVHTRFLASKAPAPWQQTEEEDALPKQTQDTGVTVFPQDKKGLHLFNYHLKGFIKESGNVQKEAVVTATAQPLKPGNFTPKSTPPKRTPKAGITALRSKVDNYVFVLPRKIYFHRMDGSFILEPDDVLQRPLRAQTMQGPRVSLASSELIHAPAYMEFQIELVEGGPVTWDVIEQLLDYGRLKGISQWRNGGFGTFKWEEIKPAKMATA